MHIKQNQSQDDGLSPQLHAPIKLGEYFVTKIDTVQRQIDADFTDLTVPEAFISVGNTSKLNSNII